MPMTRARSMEDTPRCSSAREPTAGLNSRIFSSSDASVSTPATASPTPFPEYNYRDSSQDATPRTPIQLSPRKVLGHTSLLAGGSKHRKHSLQSHLIDQLVAIHTGALVHKKRRRWVVLDAQNLYIFKGREAFKAPKVINLHCTAVRRLAKEATPSFEVLTSSQTFLFTADKEERQDKETVITAWIEKIRSVCDSLVLSSIGSGTSGKEPNILERTYSRVSSYHR